MFLLGIFCLWFYHVFLNTELKSWFNVTVIVYCVLFSVTF